MKVRHRFIKNKQKQRSYPKSDSSRNKRKRSHRTALLNGRYQQAPNRSRRHHSCRKSSQGALKATSELFLYKEYKRRTKRSADEGYQDTDYYRCIHDPISDYFVMIATA